MPISFSCPFCGAHTEVDDFRAGQAGTCETCAQPITIPLGVPAANASVPKGNNAGLVAAFLVLGGFAVVAMLGLVAWLAIPAITSLQTPRNKTICGNNLKQIAIALHGYHDDYQCFPPAFVTDDKGKPMHSWRVLILPYLGQDEVYSQYRFDEPWDGPNNSLLTGRMPKVYFCPENPDPKAQRAGEVNYMVIVGRETMFPGKATTSLADVTDGTSNTIMVVETNAPGVNWMSPVDLNLSSMKMQINAGPNEPGSFHPGGGVHVAMGDGSVHFLPEKTRSREMYNSVTRGGGEPAHLNAVTNQ